MSKRRCDSRCGKVKTCRNKESDCAGLEGGQKGREKKTRNISPNRRGQKKNRRMLVRGQAPGGVFSFRFGTWQKKEKIAGTLIVRYPSESQTGLSEDDHLPRKRQGNVQSSS